MNKYLMNDITSFFKENLNINIDNYSKQQINSLICYLIRLFDNEIKSEKNYNTILNHKLNDLNLKLIILNEENNVE